MAEYIDREALIAEYDRVHVGKPGRARKLMEKAPAVDAVPVVRCKDCKYQEYCMRRIPFFGRNLILELNIAEYHPLGFCSYGERKDNET